ncbi:ATP-binding protein [Litorilituus sediminis]|uniref:histidine kinase n=1 Tax=Litorilituus sediminis TaxID=718192 RepID=A0A4P6P474_9GAMM|nr:ATP-binding protein [Litorilituus sediminis]QBG35708.1 HAMP domain-containing protein [Litorilituus sediminis]
MKIHNKLFLTLLLFGITLVIAIVSFMQWSLDKGMVNYVNKREINALAPVVTQLAQSYQQRGSWHFIRFDDRRFQRLIRQALSDTEFTLPRPEHRPPPQHRERRAGEKMPGKPDKAPVKALRRPPQKPKHDRYAVLDADKRLVVGHYNEQHDYSMTEIFVADSLIGYFAVVKRHRLTSGYELDFIEQQRSYLWLISLAIMCLVVLISLPLASHIVAPIRALAKGMHQLTQGQYQSRLSIERKDEFAQLTRDFNELAKTLLANESARKRWLANISHELRTPLAVLKAELEAVIDGVRVLSMGHVQSTHQEVLHLERLIADLHALTSADIGGMSYRKEPVDLVAFIDNCAKQYQSYLSDAGYTLQLCNYCKGNYSKGNDSNDSDELLIFADKTRLSQLLENLFSNTVKYAENGTIVKLTLAKNSTKNSAIIRFEDNGQGVANEHLAHLFEHLYRVDDSRSRATGGSGLGLSICAHIVNGHQGKIEAQSSQLGGLAIVIELPLIN